MKLFFIKYGAYLFRWQLSTPILAPVVGWCATVMGWNFWIGAAIANLIGGLIFFWVDRFIFSYKGKDK